MVSKEEGTPSPSAGRYGAGDGGGNPPPLLTITKARTQYYKAIYE